MLQATKTPTSAPDKPQSVVDLFSACKEQERLLDELEAMSENIGKSKAIKDIASDYRKRILARLMDPLLRSGDSAASAEVKARAMKLYDEGIAEHEKDLAWAEEKLARREWVMAKLEAIRTVIATERSLMEMR
jgi:hypothetical protein